MAAAPGSGRRIGGCGCRSSSSARGFVGLGWMGRLGLGGGGCGGVVDLHHGDDVGEPCGCLVMLMNLGKWKCVELSDVAACVELPVAADCC
jgi:hypothetical protein